MSCLICWLLLQFFISQDSAVNVPLTLYLSEKWHLGREGMTYVVPRKRVRCGHCLTNPFAAMRGENSAILAHEWAVWKRLNWSTCRFGGWLMAPKYSVLNCGQHMTDLYAFVVSVKSAMQPVPKYWTHYYYYYIIMNDVQAWCREWLQLSRWPRCVRLGQQECSSRFVQQQWRLVQSQASSQLAYLRSVQVGPLMMMLIVIIIKQAFYNVCHYWWPKLMWPCSISHCDVWILVYKFVEVTPLRSLKSFA